MKKNKKPNFILHTVLGFGVFFLSFNPTYTFLTSQKSLKKITSFQDIYFIGFEKTIVTDKNIPNKMNTPFCIKSFFSNLSVRLGNEVLGQRSRRYETDETADKNNTFHATGTAANPCDGADPEEFLEECVGGVSELDSTSAVTSSTSGTNKTEEIANTDRTPSDKANQEEEKGDNKKRVINTQKESCKDIPKGLCNRCQKKFEATQTCCGREQGNCLQKSGKGQLLKTFGSRAALLGQALVPGASGNLNKNCQMLKSLMDMSVSLSTTSAELCYNNARNCDQTCRNAFRSVQHNTETIKKLNLALSNQSEQEEIINAKLNDCEAKMTKGQCQDTSPEQIENFPSQCMNLAQNIVPVFNRQAVASQYSGGLAQQCAALTGNANGNPFANSNNPPPGSNSPCSGPQAQFLPFCQNPNPRGLGNNNRGGPGFSLDNTGDPSNLLPDMDESPLGAQAFDGHPNSGNFPSSGQVNSPGGGGGGLGAGGGMGGGGSNSLASQTPQKGAGKSGTGPKSILQGFRKGGGYSSPSGSSGFGGGYSSPGGTVDGYGGKGLGKYKGLNLKKYLPKDILAKQKAKQTQRHIASSTTDIFQNVSTRFQTICHKKNLYCNK